MKRLSSIFSSDSDSEECSISKIKEKYKRSKKESNKESTSDLKVAKKKKELPKNQPSIKDAFGKIQPVKRHTTNTLEQYFSKPDTKSVKKEITPAEFFSTSKKSKDIDDNLKSEPVLSKPSPEKSKPIVASMKFVVEKPSAQDSPNVSTIKTESESFTTPTKTPQKIETIASPPKSASKKHFHTYLNRQGPSAIGSKEIPEGSPNCLTGWTFVMTGVMDSIERDDAQALIEKHGGRVTKALSGKTTYLVVGSDPGESKIQKAQKLNTKQINEDELFNLIRTSASKTVAPKPAGKKPSMKLSKIAEETDYNKNPTGIINKTALQSTHIVNKQTSSLGHSEATPEKRMKFAEKTNETTLQSTHIAKKESSSSIVLAAKPMVGKTEKVTEKKSSIELLVDKYKPTIMKHIVGQQGDRSPAKKLHQWLINWQNNYRLGFKKNGEADHFRAALLSGPPGIGKTTTAHVVCRELGYHIREYNASSSRSKKDMVQVNAITQDSNSKSWNEGLKYCVIMDEIDGMTGSDRGGISELITIIKNSKVPIICLCNDRNSMKLRSIANYLYDLRFRQLTLEQIKATVKSISFKEKIPIPDEPLNEIIMTANFDLRQIINNLQMWSVSAMDSDTLKSDARKAHKEFKLGPFDVVMKVFSYGQAKTFNEKLDLFFEDHELGGLFVQENYLNVAPSRSRNNMNETLRLMSVAADSIASADIVSQKLRSKNEWGLLPLQGVYASVIPGTYLQGRLNARVNFPSWLGKFSNKNKNFRILSNLSLHLRNSTKGGASSPALIAMYYGQLLVKKIMRPLREGDIEATLNILNQTNLLREDIDLLIETTSWSHSEDLLASVSSQIKGALTRAYNKSNFKVPYSIVSIKKGRAADDSIVGDEEAEEEEETNEKDDGIDNDCMIVKKQAKAKPARKPTATKPPKKESVKKEPIKKAKLK